MSESPNMAYLAAIPEVLAMEATGSSAAPKHFVGNDQEFHREGVVKFFNE
jgi:beta-glucosidase